jgi:cardiolipin synthase
MVWLVIILVLFIFQTATILIGEYKHPSKTVAWLMVLFIFPIIGFVMYYFLATEYKQRKTVRRKGSRRLGEFQRELLQKIKAHNKKNGSRLCEIHQETKLFGLLHNTPGAPITSNNKVQVLTNADKAFPAMLQAIAEAKDHIHFEFYTIRGDRIGTEFQEALIRKAREGVEVKVIYDGVGSYHITSDYIHKFRKNGIQIYPFLPPLIAFFDKRMNYRNHRKIIVVDGVVGFMGGMNIGDEYLGGNPQLGFWRDTHLQIEGDAVYSLQHTFLTDWAFVSGQKLTDSTLFPEHSLEHPSFVQIIASGPDAHWDSILEMFFSGIVAAKKRVFMTTPYFIPDASIMMALKTAAISGVDVRIMIPDVADSRIVQLASRSYLKELMQAGVKVFLYKKGFIHSKVIIFDHFMATVGSANMDMRSFFSNFELNAVLFDKDSINRLEMDFMADLKESIEIKLAEFEKRSRVEKGKEAVARLLSPLF